MKKDKKKLVAEVKIGTQKYVETPDEWFDEWFVMNTKNSKIHVKIMYTEKQF